MTQRNVGDQRVLSALKQMADLHRNPLIHPDTVLTMDEVQATIGMARSVTALMLGALPAPPPTTATAPVTPP